MPNFGYGLDVIDVDGNGYGDVVVGSGNAPGIGRAYLYRSSAAGLAAAPQMLANPPGCSDSFGTSIDVGDLDGDGLGDAVIGCDWGPAAGRIQVYLGTTNGLAPDPGQVLLNPDASGGSGFTRASLGDLDGDGKEDLLVGAWKNDVVSDDEGVAYLYTNDGTAPHFPAAPSVTIQSPSHQSGAAFGGGVDLNHDVNGDGLADPLIAAFYHGDADSAREGWVFVYPTAATGQLGPAVTYENPLDEAGGLFGARLRQ